MPTLLETLIEAAKKSLEKDGHICPVFFLLRDDSFVMKPTPMAYFDKISGAKLNAEESKTRDVFLIGGLAQKLGANKVILIWDAAMRTASANQEYSALEAPLTYPKSMRTECIIINEIWLPEGKDHTTIIPYKGGDGEPVEFLPNNFPEGATLKSRFTEVALDGYNRAKEIIIT
jgi:hypothetical protein